MCVLHGQDQAGLLQSLQKALELRQNQIEALSEVANVDLDGGSESHLGEPIQRAAGVPSFHSAWCCTFPSLAFCVLVSLREPCPAPTSAPISAGNIPSRVVTRGVTRGVPCCATQDNISVFTLTDCDPRPLELELAL